MILANGENRKALALAIGCAFLAAVGTELGKWWVERARKLAGDDKAPSP